MAGWARSSPDGKVGTNEITSPPRGLLRIVHAHVSCDNAKIRQYLRVRKMKVDYESYKSLKIMRLAPRILEVVMSNPGKLNALDRRGHGELAEIWRDVDADPDVSCVLLRGEGGNFSAGGDLTLLEEMASDWNVRTRVARSARYRL
jgi:hypothetical protein